LNILIVTPYFHPENFRINDFALEFKNKGHNISVLTPIPNYPDGKYYKGYGLFKKTREYFDGIIIYRSPLIPRGSGTNWMLGISWLSSILGNLLTSIFLLKKTFDLIFVFGPSPFTICLPAIFIKKIKKIPICFWVLDLWPESVVSAGNLKSGLIPKLLTPIVKFIYHNSDKILVSSKGFIESIVDKGINARKIEFFPQWAEPIFRPVEKRRELLPKIIPKESFKIMFAGNIGEAQDFPAILNAAKLLKSEKNIHWIIIGNGRRAEWVKNQIIEYGLQDYVHMLGRHPIEKMPDYYALADAMLFSLKDEYIFSITIPAKVQSYLACGKPILAMVNGEAPKIINENKAGYTCAAGDYKSLVDNVIKMSELDNSDLEKLSVNSLQCYINKFERDMLLNKVENILKNQIL
jgi:glycosyltransferase involved in cell wall biosynthesis